MTRMLLSSLALAALLAAGAVTPAASETLKSNQQQSGGFSSGAETSQSTGPNVVFVGGSRRGL